MEIMQFELPPEPEPEQKPATPPKPAAETLKPVTSTNSAVELLRKVRELLSDENRWSHHPLAETADGKSCWDNNTAAVKWGLIGALARCRGWPFPMQDPYTAITEALGHTVAVYDPLKHNKLLDDFNKTATHSGLLSMLDTAIAIEVGRHA